MKVLNYFGVWHEDIESRIVSWLESNGVSSSFPVEPRMTVRGFLSSAVDQRQVREELAVGISVRIQRANNNSTYRDLIMTATTSRIGTRPPGRISSNMGLTFLDPVLFSVRCHRITAPTAL